MDDKKSNYRRENNNFQNMSYIKSYLSCTVDNGS